jgi:sensor histidine kinase regulating citrate/malate metabolism
MGLFVFIKQRTRPQIYGIQSLYQALIIMLPAFPYFYMRDYARLLSVQPANVPSSTHLITVICGICALINMIISENLSYQIRQNEILRMEKIINKQHDQYRISQNTIEAVNRKYHDLRHILRGIESMQEIEEIKSFIHTLEGEIKDYSLICNTGNQTIDIILSDKIQACEKLGIHMHIHADGQGWNIIRDGDIATIFGNALDNAMESMEGIADGKPKIISVRTGRVNDMLIARFENRFIHTLERKQEQFVSTKLDKLNHGYGLQSIEITAKKYGGEINIKTENGKFILTIIIPFTATGAIEPSDPKWNNS